jgi:preprotein translocase subunit YajC
MFRKTNGTAKRFDPNALTLSQLQTLKQRLIAVLDEFLNPETNTSTARGGILGKIDAIQEDLNTIAIKLAIA